MKYLLCARRMKRVRSPMEMLLVGRTMNEKTKGRPTYWTTAGRVLEKMTRSREMASIRIEGPCCQRARLAVDHTEVQQAKTKTRSKDIFRFPVVRAAMR